MGLARPFDAIWSECVGLGVVIVLLLDCVSYVFFHVKILRGPLKVGITKTSTGGTLCTLILQGTGRACQQQ